MNFYWITLNNKNVHSIAYAPMDLPLSHTIIECLAFDDEIPFSLVIHNCIETPSIKKREVSDIFYDYLPNSLAWPIMSAKMKTIICKRLTGKEHLVWKPILVYGATRFEEYYIPYFTQSLNVLNNKESFVVPSSGIVIKPCFDKKQLEGLSVFHGPTKYWRITTQLYVSEDIMKDLVSAEIKELSFVKARVK